MMFETVCFVSRVARARSARDRRTVQADRLDDDASIVRVRAFVIGPALGADRPNFVHGQILS